MIIEHKYNFSQGFFKYPFYHIGKGPPGKKSPFFSNQKPLIKDIKHHQCHTEQHYSRYIGLEKTHRNFSINQRPGIAQRYEYKVLQKLKLIFIYFTVFWLIVPSLEMFFNFGKVPYLVFSLIKNISCSIHAKKLISMKLRKL